MQCSTCNEFKRNLYSRKLSFSNFFPRENYPLYRVIFIMLVLSVPAYLLSESLCYSKEGWWVEGGRWRVVGGGWGWVGRVLCT